MIFVKSTTKSILPLFKKSFLFAVYIKGEKSSETSSHCFDCVQNSMFIYMFIKISANFFFKLSAFGFYLHQSFKTNKIKWIVNKI